jgi:hypothetical protein
MEILGKLPQITQIPIFLSLLWFEVLNHFQSSEYSEGEAQALRCKLWLLLFSLSRESTTVQPLLVNGVEVPWAWCEGRQSYC